MAFKYKLPKKQSGLTPEKLQTMGAEVDLGARKEFVSTPANTDKSEELEKLIIYSLEDADFSPEDIDNYLEFLYIERNNNIGGEFGDTNLNEKTDPIQNKFDDILARFKREDEESELNPNSKNTFKEKIKEAVIKRLSENKPCWKGYEQIGMKKKNGKDVPNCVPKRKK